MSKKKITMKKRAIAKKRSSPGWHIRCMDCIRGMRDLQDTGIKPDLIFADPPFNYGFDYDKHDDSQDPRAYRNWCAEWLAEIHMTLSKHGTFWLAICDEHVSELDVMAKGFFHKRSHIIWYYTFGVACSKNFSRSHTHLLYYTKTKTKFTWTDAVRVPSARQLVYNDKRANPKGKLPDNTWILNPLDLERAFVHGNTDQLDTWLASRVCGTFKEREKGAVNQMPLGVMERIILATSNPGDLVLDPFGGTFTTGEAAILTGRHFIGFDISKEYCQRGRGRLRRAATKIATI